MPSLPQHRNGLSSVYSDLLSAADDGQVFVLCLLDLTASFNTVDHDLLLHRLECLFGLHGVVLSWFRSCMRGRSFRVLYCGSMLATVYIVCSVLQGSVLGPVDGYFLFTADLEDVTEKHGVMLLVLADDTQLYLHSRHDDTASSENCQRDWTDLLYVSATQVELWTKLSYSGLHLGIVVLIGWQQPCFTVRCRHSCFQQCCSSAWVTLSSDLTNDHGYVRLRSAWPVFIGNCDMSGDCWIQRKRRHWSMPVSCQFKLMSMMHNCLHHTAPHYSMDYCIPISDVASRWHVSSARHHHLVVPQHSLGLCRHTVAGPTLWLHGTHWAMMIVLDICLKLGSVQSTSTYSTLEKSHFMCYINSRLTYLIRQVTRCLLEELSISIQWLWPLAFSYLWGYLMVNLCEVSMFPWQTMCMGWCRSRPQPMIVDETESHVS